MLQRGLILFIVLMMATTLVRSETSLDRIIRYCQWETERFASTEEKYATKHVLAPDEPSLSGPPLEHLQRNVYEKEKRQRTFECINDHTDGYSLAALQANPKYQELVFECKSKKSQPLCDRFYPYRTFDGTCNNLINPNYGSVLNCLTRVMEQNYQGAGGMRQSVCGKPLPEPRFISRNLHDGIDLPSADFTQVTTLLGQFLAHDITDVPNTVVNGKIFDCCSDLKGDLHPQCAPILLLKDEPFYHIYNVTCFNFQRTSLCDTCSVGKRNQLNQETSYLDLSATYGTSDSIADALRTKDGTGKLIVQKKTTGDLLPRLCTGRNRCAAPDEPDDGFVAGDRRANMHASLMSLHTLFLREHNQIAEELKGLNPHWGEERLYQEARKINTAQFQLFIYEEHLPVLLGPDIMARYKLTVNPSQSRTTYDATIDATLSTEFNTAAYRLHSVMNGELRNSGLDDGKVLLRDTFFEPKLLYQDKISSLMQGVCQSSILSYDRFVSNDMTGFVYKRPKGHYGLDMFSINIQRGRDNGLPTYTQLVNHLTKGAINIQSFDDLQIFMDKDNIELLRKLYCDVRDIDLWVGMNNERVEEDCVLGPTSSEVNGMQFRNLKFGDRFYFEHYGNFNNEQLQSLKRMTLSSVICRNTNIKGIQLNAHKIPSQTNPIRLCEDIPKLNISLWKE